MNRTVAWLYVAIISALLILPGAVAVTSLNGCVDNDAEDALPTVPHQTSTEYLGYDFNTEIEYGDDGYNFDIPLVGELEYYGEDDYRISAEGLFGISEITLTDSEFSANADVSEFIADKAIHAATGNPYLAHVLAPAFSGYLGDFHYAYEFGESQTFGYDANGYAFGTVSYDYSTQNLNFDAGAFGNDYHTHMNMMAFNGFVEENYEQLESHISGCPIDPDAQHRFLLIGRKKQPSKRGGLFGRPSSTLTNTTIQLGC